MVGRFVHNQKVRLIQNNLQERHAGLLPTAQVADALFYVLTEKHHLRQQIPRFAQCDIVLIHNFVDNFIIGIQLAMLLVIVGHLYPRA